MYASETYTRLFCLCFGFRGRRAPLFRVPEANGDKVEACGESRVERMCLGSSPVSRELPSRPQSQRRHAPKLHTLMHFPEPHNFGEAYTNSSSEVDDTSPAEAPELALPLPVPPVLACRGQGS